MKKSHEGPATAVAMGRSASSVAMPVPTCQGETHKEKLNRAVYVLLVLNPY